MKKFSEKLKGSKTVIGMIHVPALPGTPNNSMTPREIIKRAVAEAGVYNDCGIDSVAIENMHDVPYLNRNVGPEITSIMSVIGYEIKTKYDLTCGIQILAGANKDALAAAYAAGLDFIRAEGFVFAHVADEGIMYSDAAELLRYRKSIGADSVSIFTDIKKKHSSHAITSDASIVDTAKAAEFFNSDGIIVTGSSTGAEADINELTETAKSVNLPVIIGSGITEKNLEQYYPLADAFIVGSGFKLGGVWSNKISRDRVKRFIKKFTTLSG